MNPWIEEIRSFLSYQTSSIRAQDARTLIEALWNIYGSKPDAIKEQMCALEPFMNTLSQKRSRQIICTATEICMERERDAFWEGVRVGAAILLEITK